MFAFMLAAELGGSLHVGLAALGAALAEMVCKLSLGKKSLAANHERIQMALARLGELRAQLSTQVDRDAASYDAVVAALRQPKATEAEQTERARAVKKASTIASQVPLATAELGAETQRLIQELRPITFAGAASDLAVASHMAGAAVQGAVENVRANLPSIRDGEWIAEAEARIKRLL